MKIVKKKIIVAFSIFVILTGIKRKLNYVPHMPLIHNLSFIDS